MYSSKISKINIRYFLNTKLAAKKDDFEKKHYALYIVVTYKRQNTHLKSKYGYYYSDLKEVESGLMDFEKKVIRKTIEMEQASLPENKSFDIKKIKDKFDLYAMPITVILDDYFASEIEKAIKRTGSKFIPLLKTQGLWIDSFLLYEACKRLFEHFTDYLDTKAESELKLFELHAKYFPREGMDFAFPSVLDWITGEHQKQIDKKMRRIPKATREALKSLIDAAITQATLKRMIL